jgi:hypothetical protein
MVTHGDGNYPDTVVVIQFSEDAADVNLKMGGLAVN